MASALQNCRFLLRVHSNSIPICFTRGAYKPKIARIIHPPESSQTLQERLKVLHSVDPDVYGLVDIGFPGSVSASKDELKARTELRKLIKKDRQLFQDSKHLKLLIDLNQVQIDFIRTNRRFHVKQLALHYGIFKDLFKHGIFTPVVHLGVGFPSEDENNEMPVYTGNILNPKDVSRHPKVDFASNPEDLWAIVLSNPDGNLSNGQRECLHWFVGNIRGNDLATGNELFPYLQPFPPRGFGYQRMVFTLYKQNGIVDYSDVGTPKHRFNLGSRDFSSFDFYSGHQDSLTPVGLSFFQTIWDETVTSFYHDCLEMEEPNYEYVMPKPYNAPQIKYPDLAPFNRYLERYRDEKDVRKQIVLKRLKGLDPFEEEAPMPKHPNIQKWPKGIAWWQKADIWKERNRIGKFKDLRPFTSYPEPEFSFQKMWKSSVDSIVNHKQEQMERANDRNKKK